MHHPIVAKRVCLLLALLCLALCLPALPAAAETAEPPLRVGLCETKGFAESAGEDSFTGVDVEYTYKVMQYADSGMRIVLVQDPQQGLRMLDDGKLDMLCGISRTAAREQKYLFSEQEIGSTAMCVFVRSGDTHYTANNIEQLEGMTFAAVASSTTAVQFRTWCGQHGFEPNIRLYGTFRQVQAAVDDGTADAGLYTAPALAGYRTIQTLAPTSYYYIFRKSSIALKNRIDDAMSGILAEDPLYYDRLLNKYTASLSYEMAALSNDELAYVAAHPTVRVAVLADDEPYYSTDGKGSSGIIPDYYARLSELTGLTFSYTVYQNQAAAVDAVKKGEADVIGLYSNGQIQANDAGLRITRAYANVDTVLITRTGMQLRDIQTVAVKQRSRSAVVGSVDAMFPDAEYLDCDNAEACFSRLRAHEADAMVCGLPSATWLINQHLASAYTVQALTAGTLELCSATAYDNSVLCSLLSKAMSASAYSFNEISNNDTMPRDNWQTMLSRIPPLRIAGITAVLFLLVIGLVWALISLKRRTRERAAVMAQQAQNERRQSELNAQEQANESKNRFFSSISHDMRTPLNAIIGFSQLAQEQPVSPEVRDYLVKIQASGNLLLELISDTLLISRANSGKLQLKPEPLSLADVLDSVAVPIQAAAAKKQIILTEDRTGLLPRTVLADRLNLQKILLNLLANAVKYTPSGGHVWLAARDEPPAQAAADALPVTVVTVRDDGIGMTPEFLQHLYEPFVQENRAGYETKGTGLGLSIVRQLVELMDGTITVQSAPDKGTVFTLRLCFAAAPDAAAKPLHAAVPAADGTSLAGRRILLCEDNSLNAEIAGTLLRAQGASVVTAENGALGVERFRDSAVGAFDAVLMDVRMPVMDGCEATRRIRALDRPDARNIPVIAMTADAFDEDRNRGLAAGMTAYLTKPIEPQRLIGTLRQYLG